MSGRRRRGRRQRPRVFPRPIGSSARPGTSWGSASRATRPSTGSSWTTTGTATASQGLPPWRRAGAVLGRRVNDGTRPDTPHLRGHAAPVVLPPILVVDPEKHRRHPQINFGPNHPSTHGVLRLIVDLTARPSPGSTRARLPAHGLREEHGGKTWWKRHYTPRADYLAFFSNDLSSASRSRSCSGSGPAPREVGAHGVNELNRLHSHLSCSAPRLWTSAAIALLLYRFDDRDAILALFEMAAGVRMHTRYAQVGGLAEDLPLAFTERPGRSFRGAPLGRRLRVALDRNTILLDRTRGIGVISRSSHASSAYRARCARLGRGLGISARTCRTAPTTRSRSTSSATRTATSTTATRCTLRDAPVARIVEQCSTASTRMRPAVDRRRPQGRAAAEARAAHLDGVADPPLQARHRGLRRPRG